MAQIKCKKCGANVEFDTGTKFAKCSYCSSQIYIDKSGAGFFYILPYFIDINSAGGIFKRWTAGSKMAKNLESEARVMQFKQQYFPIYMFKRDIGGREIVFIEPAKTTTLPGMHNLKV
ncbi:MAG: zinc ribbon domain-containing protein, partial [Candidatus Thermoplasmatota archaeon]